MRSLSLVFFAPLLSLSLVVACGDDGSGDDGDGGSSAQNGAGPSTGSGAGESVAMQGMTAAHNQVRANVSPAPSSPMAPLVWDAAVAQTAQSHADKCIFEHSSNNLGENLYATTGNSSPGDVVSSWASEVSDYSYGSNSCSGVCGHYTQVVWADSLRLGCAMKDCNSGSPFGSGSWQVWVCNYDPPGNFVGQKPY